jgi:hypothetical protein
MAGDALGGATGPRAEWLFPDGTLAIAVGHDLATCRVFVQDPGARPREVFGAERRVVLDDVREAVADVRAAQASGMGA